MFSTLKYKQRSRTSCIYIKHYAYEYECHDLGHGVFFYQILQLINLFWPGHIVCDLIPPVLKSNLFW